MKTGVISRRFGLDPNTIADWTDRFSEFFTNEARAKNGKQRDYLTEDIIVLNTIRGYRARNVGWDEIRATLASGERDENLPPEFVTIEGENAITVYAEMREMRLKLDTAEAEIERLLQLIEDERRRADEGIQAERKRADEQIQVERKRADERIQAEHMSLNEQRADVNEQIRLEREATQTKIEQLIRDAAVWQTRYEILNEQMKNMEKKDDE